MTERVAPDAGTPAGDLSAAVARKGSFVQTLRAVAWSFFGVRRSSGYEEDVRRLNPVHVIIAGVLATAAFIAGLLVLIQWVLASGVAAG